MKVYIFIALILVFSQSAFCYEDCGTKEIPNNKRLIAQINTLGVQDLWGPDEAQTLSFCVSEKFRSAYEHVMSISVKAAKEWMNHANVNFNIAEDMSCESNPREVLFRVVPTSRRVKFKARAFFPGSERRIIQINRRFINISEPELLKLMLHELGHVLGFRHEHIHPEAGEDCPEIGEFEPLTDYDPRSIMHYPICGRGLNNFVLSDLDKVGARIAYP